MNFFQLYYIWLGQGRWGERKEENVTGNQHQRREVTEGDHSHPGGQREHPQGPGQSESAICQGQCRLHCLDPG